MQSSGFISVTKLFADAETAGWEQSLRKPVFDLLLRLKREAGSSGTLPDTNSSNLRAGDRVQITCSDALINLCMAFPALTPQQIVDEALARATSEELWERLERFSDRPANHPSEKFGSL